MESGTLSDAAAGANKIPRDLFFGGLRLGLAISRALVDLHDGVLRAESAGRDRGATFIIELPARMVSPVAPEASREAAPDGAAASRRVLVVEDHADTAQLLSRLLEESGFSAVTAGEVAAAIATLERERERVDLLVSDLGLPDGSGHEIMRAFRERGGTAGIAMSGYGMDDDVRRSREAGFREPLIKPVISENLLAAVRRVLDQSRRGERTWRICCGEAGDGPICFRWNMDQTEINRRRTEVAGEREPTRRVLRTAQLLGALFAERGSRIVVVGGSAIELLTEGRYASGDIDLCFDFERPSLRVVAEVMAQIGATGGPRSFRVGDLFVDILGAVESLARTDFREIAGVRVAKPEDLLVERVFMATHPQPNAEARVCAEKLLAVALSGEVPVDWAEAERVAGLAEYQVAAEFAALRREVEGRMGREEEGGTGA